MNTVGTIDIFRALADDVRLRILHALLGAELSVAELVEILGLPQSTVSRHLKPLRDAGLVGTRRDGTSIYYRRGIAFEEGDLARGLQTQLRELPTAAKDAATVRRVLDQRRQKSREFFEKIAGRYGTLMQPGGGWEAMAAALAAGFAGKTVADLGAGEGQLTLLLARFAKSVTAVDQSKAMLREVSRRAKEECLSSKIKTAEGDLESLPLRDESVDAVFLSQALHHAAQPEKAISEAGRIVRKGGSVIVLDLARHGQEWAREQWADQWLGFEEDELRGWMRDAGLQDLLTQKLAGATPEISVVLAVGIKS